MLTCIVFLKAKVLVDDRLCNMERLNSMTTEDLCSWISEDVSLPDEIVRAFRGECRLCNASLWK